MTSTDVVLAATKCRSCGDRRFPAKAVCSNCGSGQLDQIPITHGTVDASTRTTTETIVEVTEPGGLRIVGPATEPIVVGDTAVVSLVDGRFTWHTETPREP